MRDKDCSTFGDGIKDTLLAYSLGCDAADTTFDKLMQVNRRRRKKETSEVKTDEDRVRFWSMEDFTSRYEDFSDLWEGDEVIEVTDKKGYLLKIKKRVNPLKGMFLRERELVLRTCMPTQDLNLGTSPCLTTECKPGNTVTGVVTQSYLWKRVNDNTFASESKSGRLIIDDDIQKSIEEKCGLFVGSLLGCEVEVMDTDTNHYCQDYEGIDGEVESLYVVSQKVAYPKAKEVNSVAAFTSKLVKVPSSVKVETNTEYMGPSTDHMGKPKAIPWSPKSFFTIDGERKIPLFYKIASKDHIVICEDVLYELSPNLNSLCLIKTRVGLFQCVPKITVSGKEGLLSCEGKWATSEGNVFVSTTCNEESKLLCTPETVTVKKFRPCYVWKTNNDLNVKNAYDLNGHTYRYVKQGENEDDIKKELKTVQFERVETLCFESPSVETSVNFTLKTTIPEDSKYDLETAIQSINGVVDFEKTQTTVRADVNEVGSLPDRILEVGRVLLSFDFNDVEVENGFTLNVDSKKKWNVVRETIPKLDMETAYNKFDTFPEPLILLSMRGSDAEERLYLNFCNSIRMNPSVIKEEGIGILAIILHIPSIFGRQIGFQVHKLLASAIEEHISKHRGDQLQALSESMKTATGQEVGDGNILQNFMRNIGKFGEMAKQRAEIEIESASETAAYETAKVAYNTAKEKSEEMEVWGVNSLLEKLGIPVQFIDKVDTDTGEIISYAHEEFASLLGNLGSGIVWLSLAYQIYKIVGRIFLKIERNELVKRQTWNKSHISHVARKVHDLNILIQSGRHLNPTSFVSKANEIVRKDGRGKEVNLVRCYNPTKACFQHGNKNCLECRKLVMGHVYAVVNIKQLVRDILS